MQMYKVGYPFWKLAARMGVTITIPVFVERDDDAGVYIATSSHMRGLVVEAPSLDILMEELNDAVSMLMDQEIHDNHASAAPVIKYRGRSIACA